MSKAYLMHELAFDHMFFKKFKPNNQIFVIIQTHFSCLLSFVTAFASFEDFFI